MKSGITLFFSILLFISSAIAQFDMNSEWTWVKGDNTSGQSGVYGTQGIPSPGNKPGGRQAPASWQDEFGNFWLMGGYGLGESGGGNLNDLWKYDPSSNQWTWVKGDKTNDLVGVYGTQGIPSSGNKPGARHGAVSWTDAFGNFYLMGGYGYGETGSGYLNDIWKYNLSTNQWTWVKGEKFPNQFGVYGTLGTPSIGNTPGSRYLSVSWIDDDFNFWLMGGIGYGASGVGNLNDLWKYNPFTNEWTWVKGANSIDQEGVYGTKGTSANGNIPGARYGGVSWKDNAGNLWLMGGQGIGLLNDLWKYNISSNQWTWVNGENTPNQVGIYGTQGTPAAGNNPGGRKFAESWSDNTGKFWLIGGYGYGAFGNGNLNDLWKYDPASNQWTWVKGDNAPGQPSVYGTQGTPSPGNKPGGRQFPVSWVDFSGNRWLMGGFDGGFVNDLWKLNNGRKWYRDTDQDVFGDPNNFVIATSPPTGYVYSNTDCDDTKSTVYPGATEICDGLDNDCDGQVDEGVKTTFYQDSDGDGFGNPSVTIQACAAPAGYVSNNTDCDDANTDNRDTDGDNIANQCDNDDDGDGIPDLIEGFGLVPNRDSDFDGIFDYLDSDSDADGIPDLIEKGSDGNNPTDTDSDAIPDYRDGDADADGISDFIEKGPNGNSPIDTDSDGISDFRDTDSDGDGIGDRSDNCRLIPNPDQADFDQDGVSDACDNDDDGDGTPDQTDCLPFDNKSYPGATEICDGIDNNCNGTIDEGVLNTYYLDSDGDGYGDPAQSIQACSAPAGYVAATGDCSNNNTAINPGVTEICDGIDNNCNGQIDEGLTLITWYQDSDGDGKGSVTVSVQNCGQPSGYVGNSDDCNDNDNTIYTGATEICDGKDNDCDGIIDNGVLITYYKDQDNDGFGDPSSTIQACSVPAGYVATNTDCDDTKNNVYPGAPEICDGLDNDCDGSIDEGVKNTYYFDQDGDGFGNPALPLQSCTAPAGYVSNNTECDDTRNTVYPGAPELCDGLDNDCDNLVDEGITFITYYKDNDGDGYGDASQSVSSCSTVAGYVTIAGDCNDNATAINPGAVEVCDGIDNDCDGQIDEGVKSAYYPDTDGDGYGASTGSVQACAAPSGFVSNSTDCDDTKATVYPGAPELCDGLDNDCDGTIDEGIIFLTYYKDTDGDGYGDASQSVSSCSSVAGYVTTAGDCNDNAAAINPGAVEVCDGIDNDCDGTIDEGVLNIYYPDTDGDGYGKSTGSVTACTSPSGFVSNNTDCDDTKTSVYPGAPELCDGLDNDCDGTIDEGITFLTYYRDTDGDGYGDASQSQSSCSAVAGYVTTAGDCNDNNAAIKPGAVEVCDGIDNNCNGQIDEGVKNTYYQDSDGDGYGNATVSVQVCAAPTGYVSNNTDCNDNNAAVKPGAVEICNGIDDDCDGQIDEGVKNTYYQDSDGDGYGKSTVSVQACTAPTGYVSNSTDCNDNNAAIKPGATEICGNGIDDDCDGLTDEGCTPVNLSKVYIGNAYVTEGNSGTRNAIFTLWLSSKSATPVSVQYQTTNISATAPADYVTKTGTVTFPANSLYQVVTIQVKGDLLNESNESFMVSLASPVNATLGNTSGTGYINDDDRQPAIKIDNASATENSQLAAVKVYLTAVSGQVVKVKYETKDVSAKSPADYTSTNGQLIFQPGETVKYINVVIKKDFLNERTEDFEVKLKDAENATLESSWGGRREANVQIINSASSYNNSTIGIRETALTNQSLNLQVKVLPNPSQHQFQVNITSNGQGTLHLRVTDMQGRLLEETKTEGMTQQIKLGEKWINGTYILQVTQGEERKTIQLVKLK